MLHVHLHGTILIRCIIPHSKAVFMWSPSRRGMKLSSAVCLQGAAVSTGSTAPAAEPDGQSEKQGKKEKKPKKEKPAARLLIYST